MDQVFAGESERKGVLLCTDRLGAGREGPLERIRIVQEMGFDEIHGFQLGISKAQNEGMFAVP